MTADKLIACGYKPTLGDMVKVEYNRYGKPSGIFVVNEPTLSAPAPSEPASSESFPSEPVPSKSAPGK